ncbi:MAG: hypothetical protein ACRC80_22740, partial [Waterburya sp.]
MKKAKTILVCSQRYDRKKFSERWRDITSKLSRLVTNEDKGFIRDALLLTTKYSRMAADSNTVITVGSLKFQKYPVRGVILISPNSKKEIWIGKDALIKMLFPTTSKRIYASNKTSRTHLSMAFRQAVEDQVQSFRKDSRRMMYGEQVLLCPLSFVDLKTCEDGTEVDHAYPMSRMIEDFL